MFYSIEILRKDGQFGIIWLAATKENVLKRREYLTVDISRTCLNLKNHLIHLNNCPRLSLYLSSQLVYGAVKVHFKQVHFLLCDLMEMINKLRYQPQFGTLDLEQSFKNKKRKKKSKNTMTEALNENISLDINNLPSFQINLQEFWQPGLFEEPQNLDNIATKTDNTVHPSLITLKEDSCFFGYQKKLSATIDELGILGASEALQMYQQQSQAEKEEEEERENIRNNLTRGEALMLDSNQIAMDQGIINDSQINHTQLKTGMEGTSYLREEGRLNLIDQDLRLPSLDQPPTIRPFYRSSKRAKFFDVKISIDKNEISENTKNTKDIIKQLNEIPNVNFKTVQELFTFPCICAGRKGRVSERLVSFMQIYNHHIAINDDDNEEFSLNQPHQEMTEESMLLLPGDQQQQQQHPLTSTTTKQRHHSNQNRDEASSMEIGRDRSVMKDISQDITKNNLNFFSSSNISSISKHSSIHQSKTRIGSEKKMAGENIENINPHDSLFVNTGFIDQQLQDISFLSNQAPGPWQPEKSQRQIVTNEKKKESLQEKFQRNLSKILKRRGEKKLTFKEICPISRSRLVVSKYLYFLLDGAKSKKWYLEQKKTYGTIFIFLINS